MSGFSYHIQRRRSRAPVVVRFIWVLFIICILVYLFLALQFFTDNQPDPTVQGERLSQPRTRLISIMLKQDTILDIPDINTGEKESKAGVADDDDDGRGKHRPYPFKVPSHCPNHEMVEAIDQLRKHRRSRGNRIISVRGERHSGTKLIRTLLNKNTPGFEDINHKLAHVNMTMDTLYGWKHGFFQADFIQQVNPIDIFLIVTRDPFSWVLSMFINPYNMIFHANASDFRSFLMGSYQSQNCEAPHFLKKCAFPMEEAENIIQLRTAKYKNWTRYPNISRAILRYEDVAQDQIGTIIHVLDQHGIPHVESSSFRQAKNYIGFDGESQEMYIPNILQEQSLAHFTIDEIRFVMANLDFDFERNVLNYTYDSVYTYIDDRVQGRKPYLGAPRLLDANLYARKAKMESYRLGILNLNEYDC